MALMEGKTKALLTSQKENREFLLKLMFLVGSILHLLTDEFRILSIFTSRYHHVLRFLQVADSFPSAESFLIHSQLTNN